MELQETCTLTARAKRELEWTQKQIDEAGERINSFDQQVQEIKSNYVFLYGNLLFKARDYQKAFEKYQEARKIQTRFLSLPDETRIFPGHGESTFVEWEKNIIFF